MCAQIGQSFPIPYFFCGSGHKYTSTMVAATVRKKTASCGCDGQIARVKPSIHAPVPIALATKEAFRIFINSSFRRNYTLMGMPMFTENRLAQWLVKHL